MQKLKSENNLSMDQFLSEGKKNTLNITLKLIDMFTNTV